MTVIKIHEINRFKITLKDKLCKINQTCICLNINKLKTLVFPLRGQTKENFSFPQKGPDNFSFFF